MAEGQKIGGYQCEFVGPVPEELLCKSCKLVAREPHITGCCEERFCQACIDPVLKDKKPCPSCGEADEFSIVFTKGSHKKILALQVHCAMKQSGCEWVGQLEQLDAHLYTNCQYVDVECPSKCNQKVQKRKLATHLEKECHKREFMCSYCTYKATFEIVSNVHWPECLLFPLKCPNRCGVTCEREFIEDHMQLCSLEEVECELSLAGCKEKFLRQDQDEHMKRSVERHLKLTATATLRNKQELQEKDSEMKEALKQNLEEKDQRIRELQESHKLVQQQLQEKDAELKQELQKKDEAMKALKDDMNQELKKRDTEMKQEQTKRYNEQKAKLETTDRNIRKVIEEQHKLQEQLKARDGELTKKQETKDKQFEQQLQEKDDKLKQALQKKDEAMKALKDDMNRQLRKRDDELKLKLEEKDQQVRESAAEVTALKKQLQETDQKLSNCKDINALTLGAGVPPYHLTVVNYAELKGQDTRWKSECFYTHPEGYQCCIGVRPNGWKEGRGTHVSVWLCSAPGPFDDTLHWPAKATFTLQLLNKHRDQDHMTVTMSFEWKKTTTQSLVDNFSWAFIPHTELGWNGGKQTKYLHNDSLRFRITKIELHK